MCGFEDRPAAETPVEEPEVRKTLDGYEVSTLGFIPSEIIAGEEDRALRDTVIDLLSELAYRNDRPLGEEIHNLHTQFAQYDAERRSFQAMLEQLVSVPITEER